MWTLTSCENNITSLNLSPINGYHPRRQHSTFVMGIYLLLSTSRRNLPTDTAKQCFNLWIEVGCTRYQISLQVFVRYHLHLFKAKCNKFFVSTHSPGISLCRCARLSPQVRKICFYLTKKWRKVKRGITSELVSVGKAFCNLYLPLLLYSTTATVMWILLAWTSGDEDME